MTGKPFKRDTNISMSHFDSHAHMRAITHLLKFHDIILMGSYLTAYALTMV